jgi:hypothetical protein
MTIIDESWARHKESLTDPTNHDIGRALLLGAEARTDRATLLAILDKGGYMVCDKHPFLTTTSPTASALGCPYCILDGVAELPDEWAERDDTYSNNHPYVDCADELRKALEKIE